MKKTSYSTFLLPLVTIALLLILVAWISGAFTDKLAPGLTKTSSISENNTVTVIRKTISMIEPVPATIQAKQTSIISSRLLARIDKILVHAGDQVKKGQLLIKLEQSDLKSRVSQAKAQTKAVSARMIEAKKILTRTQELFTKGVVAKAPLEAAQANYDSLKANIATAKQSLIEAQTTLAFADIKSPISGRIVDRFAEPGDIAQPGVRLLSLYNPRLMRIEANVREKLALSLTLGQKLRVQIPAVDKILATEIEELVPAGNPGSRNFLIKSRLQTQQNLLPGMYARLMVPAGSESILTIPTDRVASVGQLDVVWVMHQGLIERRFIRIGKQLENGQIEVISGLQEGEKIMIIPSQD